VTVFQAIVIPGFWFECTNILGRAEQSLWIYAKVITGWIGRVMAIDAL
jgi:hypothetical protein